MASRAFRKALAATALATVAAGTAGCGAAARHPSSPVAAAPGILTGSITIGSFQPLTGQAAAGTSEIAAAASAYFRYVNAHGGVYGRQIIYRYLNDRGSTAMAPSITHRLVQQDNVLAIFNPAGDAAHQSVAAFLNSARVPDVFAASGCPCWDSPITFPETFGWQLDYLREGKILGAYLAQHDTGHKIGLLYSTDLAGRDGVKGLGYEIPGSQITATERYNRASATLTRQAATLRASGVRVIAAFTSHAATAALLLAMRHLSYHPQLVVASAGADPTAVAAFLSRAVGRKAASALMQGVITDASLPSAASTSSSWTALFRKVHDRYIPHLPFDDDVVSGMAAAYTFTEAILRAGPNPTRQDLINAITAGLPQGPAVAPFAYSATSHAGLSGAYIAVIRGASLVPAGPVMTTDTTPTGPITPAAPQPPAPATGIPAR